MALSNILKEPRRELTEQLLGTIVMGVAIVGDYGASVWFEKATVPIGTCPWPLGMVLLPLLAILVGLFLAAAIFLTHVIGELIADWMADRGWDPRPKRRY